MSSDRYRVREGEDRGFGPWHLYDGREWIESFQTREAADEEKKARELFDSIRAGDRDQ